MKTGLPALTKAIREAGLTVDMTEAQADVWARTILATLRPGWCGHEQKPGRWAFLDAETGEWIEVKPGVVWGAALETDHD